MCILSFSLNLLWWLIRKSAHDSYLSFEKYTNIEGENDVYSNVPILVAETSCFWFVFR